MSVSASAELDFNELGLKAPVPGQPDGYVSGSVTVAHDGGGGSMTLTLAATEKTEVLIRIENVVIRNNGAAVMTSSRVTIPDATRLYRVETDMPGGLGAVAVGEARGLVLPAYGVYFWRFGSAVATNVMRWTSDNVDTANGRLTLTGWYWYASRLRLHGPRRW